MSFGGFGEGCCYSLAHNVRQQGKETHPMALIGQAEWPSIRTKCIHVYGYLGIYFLKALLRADCLIIVIMLNRIVHLLAHTMECRTFSWANGDA